ncbi:MAG: DUF4097 family beta strand repeat-containing protein [Acidobacteriota bacterium]|nr:DUF4097 family beta strand repeat-containing protein [Acidobacteriota bacterium]
MLLSRLRSLSPTPLLILGLLAVAPPVLAAETEPIRTVDQSIPIEGVSSLHVILRIGDLTVRGTEGTDAEAQVKIHCVSNEKDKCRDAAAKIGLAWVRDDQVLRLRITGTSRLSSRHIHIESRLEAPASLPLEIDVGAGDVHLAQTTSDVEIDIGAGDATAQLSKSAMRVVRLDVNAGDAQLTADGATVEGSGLVHKALNWTQGEGKAILEIDIGSGDARVRLD